MSSIQFLFKNTKPVSENQAYKNVTVRVKQRRAKTGDAKNLEKRIIQELSLKRHEIFAFQGSHSLYDSILIANLYIFVPRNKLITKDDKISKTSGDVYNHKIFIDSVFKCFSKLDDAHVIAGQCAKLISPDSNYHMGYILENWDRSFLEEWSVDTWNKF